jgi:hypothetical protein
MVTTEISIIVFSVRYAQSFTKYDVTYDAVLYAAACR